ncbi:MAG TPA: S16 family serine protease, partial [Kofleriaceae bacterium]|nr:S16 family serine protease [Kofleriaceae bacterium]
MRKRRALVAACLVLSCGGPQRPSSKNEPPLEVKTYGPLGIKADAKMPNRAVILGTDVKDGSTIVPLPVAQGKTVVDAMFVNMSNPKNVTGGMSPVKLATAPNSDGSVQVGIFEEFAGGTGPQWRAGVWVSAFVAATTLNKDLTDFTFSATSGGYIDGASASGLMAAGFLAAMTGATVDPTVTMTGIINPDGTFGPVDGIPEKLLSAIEKGKKRVGYPIGMRNATSAKTGETVDLVALAKEHGAEAVEIADVHEAYKLLTGKTLPEPIAVNESDMALDASTDKALDAKYKVWQQRLATEWGAILQLESAGRLPALLVYLRDYAKRYAEAAEQLHKDGKLAAAYARMLAAAVYATSANQIYDVLANVQANKLDAAVASLDKLDQLDQLTKDTLTKVGTLRPPTMGGHLQMMAAFRSALRGWVFKDFASLALTSTKQYIKSLAGTPAATLGSEKTADSVVAQVGPTVLYVAKTTAETTLATEQLEFANANDISYMCSVPNVLRLATSFQSAGAAGMNYFDTLLVEPFAQSEHIPVDDARTRVAILEPDYLVAIMTSKLGSLDGTPKELRSKWGDKSLAWGLMSLAGSELAYFHAAELIAKYYSLDVRLDDARQVNHVEHEKAFTNMLATAERNARASARAARIATGAIPVQAKLAYQLASVERAGNLA